MRLPIVQYKGMYQCIMFRGKGGGGHVITEEHLFVRL